MTWHVLAIGKPKLAFAGAGIAEYTGRIKPFASIDVQFLKASSREDEGGKLLRRSKGMFRIVLDERGQGITSRELARKISAWEQQSVRTVAILVGGADGHDESVRKSANWLWSLSPLTFQHELALVVALEQIYRAYTIKGGLPYHRD